MIDQVFALVFSPEFRQYLIDLVIMSAKELVRYGDVPCAVLTAWFASLARNSVQSTAWGKRWFDGDKRYRGFVALLGVIVGLLWEYATPQAFVFRLTLRKVMVSAGGAALLYGLGEAYLPQWFGKDDAAGNEV